MVNPPIHPSAPIDEDHGQRPEHVQCEDVPCGTTVDEETEGAGGHHHYLWDEGKIRWLCCNEYSDMVVIC